MKKYLLILLIGLGLIGGIQAVQAQTLYGCFQSKSLAWTSISGRAEIAAKYGVWQYKGTVAQNNLLASRICESSDLIGFSVITDYSSTLNLPMTSSQTTVPVSSLLTKDLHTISASDFGNKVFLTIEPGGAKQELVMCTGTSGSTFTGCTRGLAFYGTSTASVAANQKTHSPGSRIIMSNSHYVYEQFVDVNSKDQTIEGTKTASGVWTFGQIPLSTSTTVTDPLGLITLGQLTSVTSTGCANASTVVRGCVEEADTTEVIAGTTAGGTGARLYINPGSFQSLSQINLTTETSIFGGIAEGDILYASASNQAELAHGNIQSQVDKIIGVAYAAVSAPPQSIQVYLPGSRISVSTYSFTIGAPVFIDDNGKPSSTPGTIRKVIGLAKSATSFIFNPDILTPTSTPGTAFTPLMTNSGGTLTTTILTTSTNNGDYLRSTSTGAFWDSISSAGGTSTVATRALDTIYRNTSTLHNGKALMIVVTVQLAPGLNQSAQVDVKSDSASTPTIILGTMMTTNDNSSANGKTVNKMTTTFIVPTNFYWRLVSSGTGASLVNVHETEL